MKKISSAKKTKHAGKKAKQKDGNLANAEKLAKNIGKKKIKGKAIRVKAGKIKAAGKKAKLKEEPQKEKVLSEKAVPEKMLEKTMPENMLEKTMTGQKEELPAEKEAGIEQEGLELNELKSGLGTKSVAIEQGKESSKAVAHGEHTADKMNALRAAGGTAGEGSESREEQKKEEKPREEEKYQEQADNKKTEMEKLKAAIRTRLKQRNKI